MERDKSTQIILTSVSNNNYLIKDYSGITIGRFSILEINEQERRSSVRLTFYKNDNEELLNETLNKIAMVIFKKKNIQKLNVFAEDTVNISAFLNSGFSIEGILVENRVKDGNQESELLFGITRIEFEENLKPMSIEIKGERINLKVLGPEDALIMSEYYRKNEEHLKHVEPTREISFYNIQTQRKILEESYRQCINGTSLDMGIFKSDVLIGKIKLSNIVYGVFKSAFVGYSIDENYQGKGYMSEALGLICDYAFEVMGLHRIEASTLMDNNKSKRVLKACGFEELGVNKSYLYIDGQWKDHLSFYKISHM